jgi:hypothetical protein
MAVEDAHVVTQLAGVDALGGVVEDEVDDHGDAAVVQGLDKVAELRVLRAGLGAAHAVAALEREGVRGAVSPLIIGRVDAARAHEVARGEGGLPFVVGMVQVLLHGKQVHDVHAEIHQMVDADGTALCVAESRAREAREASALGCGKPRKREGEILDVHLVSDDILHRRDPPLQRSRRSCFRPDAAASAGVVGHARVDVADVHGVGFIELVSGVGGTVHREVVPVSLAVAVECGVPGARIAAGHVDGGVGGVARACAVEVEAHGGGARRDDADGGAARARVEIGAEFLGGIEVAHPSVEAGEAGRTEGEEVDVVHAGGVEFPHGHEAEAA